ELLVELARGTECALHSLDQLQRTEPFGSRELAKVHAEIILGRRQVGFALQRALAGGDSLLGKLGALRVVGRRLSQIKAGAAKLPGRPTAGRVGAVMRLSVLKSLSGNGCGVVGCRAVCLGMQRQTNHGSDQPTNP